MYCSKCGNLINQGEKFCGNCGQAVPDVTQPVVENNSVNTINGESVDTVAPVINNEVVTPVEPISVEPAPTPIQQPVPTPVNQPVSNPQPTYNNVNNNKKNNSNSIIIIVAVIIIAILVGCLIFVLNKKDDEGGSSDNTNTSVNDNTNTNTNTNTNVNDNNNNNNQTNNVSDNVEKTVTFNGYTFTLPTGYTTQEDIDEIAFINPTNDKAFSVFVDDAPFDMFKDYINELGNMLVSYGYTVNNGQIKTAGGLEYIVFEISNSEGDKLLYYLSPAGTNPNHSFEGVVQDKANTYNYDMLTTMSTIIKTAKYNNSSSFSKNEETEFKPTVNEKIKEGLNVLK